MRKICALTVLIILFILGLHLKGVTFFEYKGEKEGFYKAVIISEKQEKEYTNVYKAEIDDKKFVLYIPKRYPNLEIGQIIRIKAKYVEPQQQRNYGGFDYNLYLKTKKIYGSFKAESIEIIGKNNSLKYKILEWIIRIRTLIKEKLEKNLSKESSSILIGLLIGDKTNIEKDVIEEYRKASLSHILAISGTHISYIILILDYICKRIKKKRLGQILTIIVLLFFIALTGATPSVIRASIMCIMSILSSIFKRQYDFWTSLSVSLIIQILYNPYIIFDLGLILSYSGVIGIIVFNRIIKKYIKLNSISMCLSANIVIIPILIYNYNTLSLSFFISNMFVSILIGPIIVLGFVYIFFNFKSIIFILEILLKVLNSVAKICSKIPFSEIFVSTPSIISIILFYLFLYLTLKNYKKSAVAVIILCILFNFNYQIFNNNCLLINFIDVNQGDSCLIRYGSKNILIDTGGSTDTNYDIGKNITLPYLLDRKVSVLDYVLITHFDADHSQGLMYLLKKIKIKNIIISKQPEETIYYKETLQQANKNNIKILYVKKGDIIEVGKIKFVIIHPQDYYINNNQLNNNSIVCKLKYNSFSMLFTGDIEEEAEKEILKQKIDISAKVLKVAHHGSKSSSIGEFLKRVSPQIALIGVGENNKFGHPNDVVLERLESIGCCIYRTDQNGEISLIINKKGNITLKNHIK